jgi:L-fuconate dehydratase
MAKIVDVDVKDIRFPTSLTADGSDAMNRDVDYSAAYVVLRTDDPELSGYGLTFTVGRGNDLCVRAAWERAQALLGADVNVLCEDLGGIYRTLQSDTQLRWLGPEKGVVHLALAAVMNALWDMAARRAGKPLWQLVADMTAEQIVDAADLSYVADVLTRDEAIDMITAGESTRQDRLDRLRQSGYPCYTTSAGWLGYSDEKLRRLCQEVIDEGYTHVKLKVGASREDDIRRCGIAREVIGDHVNLMIDANQVWDVPTAIDWVNQLARFNPLWIEEPTSPDDVLGHAAIRKAVAPVKVATGEHGMNRVLFKQMFQAEALDFCQIDSCRLGSVNEILTVLLMAAKYRIPVCPHAGGVGLCELVQHLSIIDYLVVSGELDGRITEYVDHLHEHFVDPCVVNNGAYQLPSQPGYSAEMYATSIAEYTFPSGTYWRDLHRQTTASSTSDPSLNATV